MNVNLTKDELALVLDGLSALPLAKSYNLFNKLALELNKLEPQTTPPPDSGAVVTEERYID